MPCLIPKLLDDAAKVVIELPPHLNIIHDLLILIVGTVQPLQGLLTVRIPSFANTLLLRFKLPISSLKFRNELFLIYSFFLDGLDSGLVRAIEASIENPLKVASAIVVLG